MGVLHPLNKMKKSQLRNIIRESIKGLMTEQQYSCDPPPDGSSRRKLETSTRLYMF